MSGKAQIPELPHIIDFNILILNELGFFLLKTSIFLRFYLEIKHSCCIFAKENNLITILK